MLEALYSTLFRPTEGSEQTRLSTAWSAWFLVAGILAFNTAGVVGLGAKGVLVLAIAFILAGLLGWYWFSASVSLLAHLLGGQGSVLGTMAAIAESLWPLLLSAPAIALGVWLPSLGELLSLGIILWVLVILIRQIRSVHHLSWGRAILCVVLTGGLAVLAPLGLLLWPVMFILGT